jgi:DNA helicase-2/ATP-dependent DNA helicase PcrA
MMRETEYTHNDFAIFYRTNAQSRVLEDQLRSHGLAYKIVGGLKFYERKEIKDVLAYMKLILNPADDVAVKRIVNVPTRGIGKTTIEKVEAAAIAQNLSLYEAILYASEHRLVHAGACKKLNAFYRMLENLREQASLQSPSETYLNVLEKTEYALRLKEEKTPEALARVENLEEFNNAILQFEQERGEEATLQSFLEEMALVSDVDSLDDQEQTVTLMTLHISKGLEYPNVFIVGMEEGLFPSGQSFDSSDPDRLEEERRLAYVGMTRAEENLFLLWARSRRVWGQEQQHSMSRFISELPPEFLDHESSFKRPDFLRRFEEKYGSYEEEASPPKRRGSVVRRAAQNRQARQSEYSDAPMPNYEEFSDEVEGAGYTKGMRVRHPTFGSGTICQVEGAGELQKVSVLFTNNSLKKFVAKYARLELL